MPVVELTDEQEEYFFRSSMPPVTRPGLRIRDSWHIRIDPDDSPKQAPLPPRPDMQFPDVTVEDEIRIWILDNYSYGMVCQELWGELGRLATRYVQEHGLGTYVIVSQDKHGVCLYCGKANT